MSHRRCPKCGKTFEEPARFCAQDGTPLVALAGEMPPSKTLVRPAATAPKPRTNERAGSLSNELLDSRYQVGKKLGEGGMSYVYLAREASTGQSVAIKVLSPRLSGDKSSVERLRREAGLAMRLDHPNVCRILRLGETEDGIIYLVMPYLPGDLLSDREVAKIPISLEAGLGWLVQMCQGLQHAHDLQIIHRDLKPENIMLVPDPDGPGGSRAVVMDFGLAKERRQEPELAKLTATGIVLGTPEFMSPEQIRGKAIDGRSDVYALGILAFEMFTGQLPFEGKSAQEMMIARLRGKARSLRSVKPELPARLDAALAKAMSLEPDERFPTMTAFAEALQATEESGIFAKLFRR
ncbi:MAG: serine/threonine-protein kinase [Gemmatimonadota bacterium]